MTLFPDPHRDIGTIKVGTKLVVTYTFDSSVKVRKIDTTCGCSLVQDTLDTVNTSQQIVIEFKAKPIPYHLAKEGKTQLDTAQQIVVYFEAPNAPGIEQQETLTFKAKIVH